MGEVCDAEGGSMKSEIATMSTERSSVLRSHTVLEDEVKAMGNKKRIQPSFCRNADIFI